MDEDSLKVLLAQGLSVEEIGRLFQRDASTIAYWLRKYGLRTDAAREARKPIAHAQPDTRRSSASAFVTA
jgi:transposase